MPAVEVVTAPVDERVAHAQARAAVRVVMYSTSWCGVCKLARRYFRAERIPFVEHDVDRDQAARNRYLALNPRGSVPTIAIDDRVMVGFGPDAFESERDDAARSRAARAAANGPKIIELRTKLP